MRHALPGCQMAHGKHPSHDREKAEEFLECASQACAFRAQSRTLGRLRVKHGFTQRKREHGSRTPKEDGSKLKCKLL
jgi:hypothetical protein